MPIQRQSSDPTYVREEIDANPIWKFAFELSELDNDHAPIGWSRYMLLARLLLAKYELIERTDR